MQVTIDYQQGLQFQARARSHRLLGDQPLDNGGSDQGMTPPEGLRRAADACLIRNTLTHPPRLNVQVCTPVSV